MFITNVESQTNYSIWEIVGIPSRGIALHSAIRDGLSYDVFLQMANLTGIEKKELAKSLSMLKLPAVIVYMDSQFISTIFLDNIWKITSVYSGSC